jgi:hypothetical protein
MAEENEVVAPEEEATNPHPNDEDPEEHIGDELPDPWADQDENGLWKEVSA